MRFALSLWIEQLIKNNNFYRFQNTPTEKRGERCTSGSRQLTEVTMTWT